jgi:signal transduction histidine kinase
MMINPHHKSNVTEKRGEKEPHTWSIATEAFLLIQELASIGAPKHLLGSRIAQFVARITNAKTVAVFWVQPKELLCEDPFGLPGPLRISTQEPAYQPLISGEGTAAFPQVAVVDGPGVIAVIACHADESAAPILKFFASVLSGALLQQREIPKFVRDFIQAKNPAEMVGEYFRALLQHINRERGALFIQDPDGVLHTVHSIGISENFLQSVLRFYPKSAGGIARAILEPIQVENTQTDERTVATRTFMKQEGISSLLIVPIIYQNAPMIGFTAYSSEPNLLSPREVARARALGLLIAPVLAAARAQDALRALPISLFYQTDSSTTPLNQAAREAYPRPSGEIAAFGALPEIAVTSKVPYLHGTLISRQVLPRDAKPSSLLLSASRALRDPLTVVWGYLGMIEGRLRRANAQDNPRMERLQSSLHRLTQLSDELFDLAQYQTNTQPTELGAALTQAVKDLNIEPPAIAPIMVRADPTRLSKVLLALLKVLGRFYPNTKEALPTIQEKSDRVQLRFGFTNPTHEQNFRLEESLGLTGAWIALLAKEWGGNFLIPSHTQVDALYLSLIKA